MTTFLVSSCSLSVAIFQGFVLFVTMCREALDDFRRYRRDNEANSQKFKSFTSSGIVNIPSSSIRVGDLVFVEKVCVKGVTVLSVPVCVVLMRMLKVLKLGYSI